MTEHKNTPDIDHISGVETTGHEWDGLKELNNPAPRWWLWVFFICCIWAAGYWVIYPAWPTLSGNTKGTSGWTQYKKLAGEQQEIVSRRAKYLSRFDGKSLEEIASDPELYEFSLAGGAAAFKDNCATCHGTGGAGGPGYPNLNDDDWLWGGTLEEIYATIRFGARSGHEKAHDSQMPAFGDMLSKQQVTELAAYVKSLSGIPNQQSEAATLFAENCVACHGASGEGNKEFGAPRLNDAIWFYGSEEHDIAHQITRPRHGVMPTWEGRLAPETIKQLAIYVHSLGGGK